MPPIWGLFCYHSHSFEYCMDLKIIAVRREDELYHFNHSFNDTIEELLMNGTEKIIDTHYYFLTGKSPVPGNEIQIEISDILSESVDNFDTTLTLEHTDEEGSTYMDEVLLDYVWLCPWLQDYFGEVPEKLYVKLYVPNKGLESFVKSTGMRGFLNRK